MTAGPVSLPPLPATGAPAGLTAAARKRLDATAREFEAVFLQQMLQPMLATVGTDGITGGGYAEEQWRGLLVEEYAKSFAAAGGIGIAAIVRQEMLRLQEARA